mmetsp:Transcript_36656/g.75154  ORF Transcript_36656/g.75154 Transcript_36656/m.75154 type:complete len:240 (+) Transcript_36656:1074-1793(+)
MENKHPSSVMSDFIGKRIDGRKKGEIRNVKLRFNIIPSSLGSLFYENGTSKLLIALYGPKLWMSKKPKKTKKNFCHLNVQVICLKNQIILKQDKERIQFLIKCFLEEIILTTLFPESYFEVIVKNLQKNGNDIPSIVNASSLVCILSGLPLKAFVSSCTTGILESKIFLDLTSEELFFLSKTLLLVIQDDYENRSLLLEAQNSIRISSFEKLTQGAVNGCLKNRLIKFALTKYVVSFRS